MSLSKRTGKELIDTVHITEEQLIEAAKRLNMPRRPNAEQLQKIADELGATYGWVAFIWDSGRIGDRLKNKLDPCEPESETAGSTVRYCISCRAIVLKKRAIRCPKCARKRHNRR